MIDNGCKVNIKVIWGKVVRGDGKAALVVLIFLRVVHLDFRDFAVESRKNRY